MSLIGDFEILKSEMIEKKMNDVVKRNKHLNEQKKENKKKTRNYWKKSIKNDMTKNVKNKNANKKMSAERKMKEGDEEEYFIFFRDTKSQKEINL
ncbi:hypothetical protein M9Y10_042806 [Tritrichomonas musculus]|uniref:Uncharacterized protein n=1 Tax=Tritrichomonas musculus TaxID=1915356 RepID=A0ABR2JYI2_9EUKA